MNLKQAPNFRCSKSCYECFENENRLDKDETEKIVCKKYDIDSCFISMDWVCDDYKTLELM